MEIRDLKKGDVAYLVFENGNLILLHCLVCRLIDKSCFQYEIVFTLDDFKSAETVYQDGNENYIMGESYVIYLNKEDAIEDIKETMYICQTSLDKLNELGN